MSVCTTRGRKGNCYKKDKHWQISVQCRPTRCTYLQISASYCFREKGQFLHGCGNSKLSTGLMHKHFEICVHCYFNMSHD